MGIKKYTAYIGIEFKHSISHRSLLIAKIVAIPLSIFVMVAIWNAIYLNNDAEIIGYFTKEQMVNYSILSVIGSYLLANRSDMELGRIIRNGKLTNELIRPNQYYLVQFFKSLGFRTADFVVAAPISIALGVIFFGFKQYDYVFTLMSVLSFSLSFLLIFLFNMIFGLIAFKVIDYDNFGWLKNTLVSFFSGGIISLSVFPLFFQNTMMFLPFQHMLYTPIRIFVGGYVLEQCILFIFVQAIWVVSMFFIMKFGWKMAVKNFSGVGT
ncbi:MAG: ABC-2 family transporter protein [Candidatus Nanoarchaeia archaeon]|nr:ABC-2 family transporter protein [Candidatus Nanoarchaeia archaeon]